MSGMDFNKMLEQVQQMQQEMHKAQEELKDETVQATAGGGMVTVNDPEMLEDLVVAAVNEALRSSQALIESKLGPALGGLSGLGLPGM